MTTRKATRASERINSRRSLQNSSSSEPVEQPPKKKTKVASKKKTKVAPKNDDGKELDSGLSDSGAPKDSETASEEKAEPIDLSPLLTVMPLDMFQEVLSHLHPRDLILVSRVSRQFREHLLSKNSTVWRMSRERVGAPDCPGHLSETAWASLLFLPRCQICGEPDVQIVDFFIQRRLCSSCRSKNLVDKFQFEKVFPQYSVDILDLVPYTLLYVSFRSSLSQNSPRYYLVKDIKEIALKLETYQQVLPVVDAAKETELNIFKKYQKAKIRIMHKSASSFQSWFHNHYLKQHITGNILLL